ncbi:hypothetical protein PABY_21350 [Pyrodictium abyssi]|uniref:BED-type domain-containing protein n=1 Tax=Pyrodictium abyssi TaxID=54256 RepID=A0ABN6ZUJ5_9CREN|nr:hypothetical protein PABY_21350 [Pyrodictium abyssi]
MRHKAVCPYCGKTITGPDYKTVRDLMGRHMQSMHRDAVTRVREKKQNANWLAAFIMQKP